MLKTKLVKLASFKFILAVVFSFILLIGCGKKESTTKDDKKTDSKTESSESITLDKPIYVEFAISGDMTGTVKAYYKDKKVRSESSMKIAGNEAKSTMYSDGTMIYTVTEVAGMKTGMKMDASKFNDPNNKKNNMMDISSFKDRMKDYTKIGEEDILGRHCDIYQSNKNANVKMSVYKETLPLKIQSEKMTMVATKIDKDVSVNDDLFTPPSDVKYIDMGNMMEDLKNPDKMKDMQDKMKEMEEGMKNYKK